MTLILDDQPVSVLLEKKMDYARHDQIPEIADARADRCPPGRHRSACGISGSAASLARTHGELIVYSNRRQKERGDNPSPNLGGGKV